MCDSSIPLPDFDFDDFDDFDEITPFGNSFRTSPKCGFKASINDLVKAFGFQLVTETAIKETGNSCVYTASIASVGKTILVNGNNFDHNYQQLPSNKYALKVSTSKSRMLKEFENYERLPKSSKLVESYDIFELNEFMILQMELCKGDIYGALLEEKIIWKLIHDISEALNIIHSSDFIHLDVSPSNILVKDNDFKLADFGNVIESGSFKEGDEGSGPYVAPEVLSFPGNKEIGYVHVWSAADIFSFGVVLLESASGYFAPRGGTLMYEELRKGNLKLGEGVFKCNCSMELVSLINSMLNPDPIQRPTAWQIMNHPYVKRLDS